MFRIRPIYDTTVPIDAQRVEQVQAILAERFPLIAAEEVQNLPATLKNPLGKGYRTIVFVAEGQRRVVQGFALLCHFSDLRFCYLDYLSVSLRHGGRGVAGADAPTLVDPSDGLQLGVLADERLGAAAEVRALHILVG